MPPGANGLLTWQARRSSAISDVHLGRQILEIVCAASLSAASGTEAALPYAGPRDLTPIELWRPAA